MMMTLLYSWLMHIFRNLLSTKTSEHFKLIAQRLQKLEAKSAQNWRKLSLFFKFTIKCAIWKSVNNAKILH